MKQDRRSPRYLWAPGEYLQTCRSCEEDFVGDKRALMCADCAYALPYLEPERTTPEELDRLRAENARLREALRPLVSQGCPCENCRRAKEALGE